MMKTCAHKYSFLLPAYKSKFLKESLESILNQTYRDYEVIVSDDCSPEDIKAVVEQFDDPRISYRRNTRNIGAEHLVDHWNLLLGLTKSDYIIMASDDDVYDREYLSEIDSLTEKYPESVIFRPLVNHIDSNGNVIFKENPLGKDFLPIEEYLNKVAHSEIFSGMQQYVFNRAALVDKGGFVNYPAAWFSDDATVINMAENGIPVCDRILYSMLRSNLSISSDYRSYSMKKSKIDATAKYADFLRQKVKNKYSNDIYHCLMIRANEMLWGVIRGGNLQTFPRALIYSFRYLRLHPILWRMGLMK